MYWIENGLREGSKFRRDVGNGKTDADIPGLGRLSSKRVPGPAREGGGWET